MHFGNRVEVWLPLKKMLASRGRPFQARGTLLEGRSSFGLPN
jgi:hypothetical protein